MRSSSPFGSLDAVRPDGHRRVALGGWTIDPDTRRPIQIHVYANDRLVRIANANLIRTDVGRAYPSYGSTHGFDLTIGDLPPGRTRVCAFAINWGWGTTSPPLGCRTVTVPDRSPFGNVDIIRTVGPGQARVAGWTIDPETANPIRAHIYVNGRFVASTLANRSRPDVGRVYPRYGSNHGFNLTLDDLASGPNEICVWSINVGQGVNNQLTCRTVIVPAANPEGSGNSPSSTSGTSSTLPTTTSTVPPTSTDPSTSTVPPSTAPPTPISPPPSSTD